MSTQKPPSVTSADLRGFSLDGPGVRLHVLSMEALSPLGTLGLTPAERAVASALLRGLSHREIASMRGTRPRTVANQIQSIYRKAGVFSREELACMLLALHREPFGGVAHPTG